MPFSIMLLMLSIPPPIYSIIVLIYLIYHVCVLYIFFLSLSLSIKMIWQTTWTTLTLKTPETTTRAGKPMTRWKRSKTTASSPSPSTRVDKRPRLRSHALLSGPSRRVQLLPNSCLCPGSVFCVSLDPATNTLAVTGGEDDKAYVWRVSDGEVLLECTGEC